MIRRQHEDKNLILLFILDLLLYFIFSLPYTLTRLILDLFVKDQVKISLDFFILFKSSLLAFHVHLTVKFFLMLALNRNFRKCLAWAFSIQNSSCWRRKNHQTKQDGQKRRRKCWRGPTGWWPGISSSTDSNLDVDLNLYRDYTSCSLDEENYHSTEFNSNHHQFFCPAEPAETDFIPNLGPSRPRLSSSD